METDDRKLAAVFAYIEGNDPTYSDIFDGAWLNNLPYAVVHRLASAGIMHDVHTVTHKGKPLEFEMRNDVLYIQRLKLAIDDNWKLKIR